MPGKGSRPQRSGRRISGLNVRPATERDRLAWGRLRNELWPNSTRGQLAVEMRSYLGNRKRAGVFVAEAPDGSLVGFVEVSLRPCDWPADRPRMGFLEGLFVLPGARRRGVARELVGVAEAWARAHGARSMGSDTHPEYRTSRSMHRALGYREIEALIVFEKRLR